MLANTTMMIAEPARAQLHKNLTAYFHAQPPATLPPSMSVRQGYPLRRKCLP